MCTEKKNAHRAALFEFGHDAIHHLAREVVLDSHAHVHLARADQVDDDPIPVERTKDAREEPVRHALSVRVHVEYDDALLDRDCRRQTFTMMDGFRRDIGE